MSVATPESSLFEVLHFKVPFQKDKLVWWFGSIHQPVTAQDISRVCWKTRERTQNKHSWNGTNIRLRWLMGSWDGPELHFCCPQGSIRRHGKQRDSQTPLLQLQEHTSPMQLQALMRWRTPQILSEWVEISLPQLASLVSPAPNSLKQLIKVAIKKLKLWSK